MIIFLVGDNGSGKTLYLVMESLKINRPIWSNFKLFKHPFYTELTLDKIINLDNGDKAELEKGLVMFIDEAYGLLESRLSNRSVNIYLSYKTNYQWRKRLLDVYLTFQDASSIDKRYRMRYDILIECGYREPFSKEPFTYHYYRRNKKNNTRKIIYTQVYAYEQMEKLFDFYNTYEIVEPPNIALMNYKMIKDDIRLYKKYLNKYYDLLLPQYDNGKLKGLTHELLELKLISEGILPQYEKKLYSMLKNKIRL